MARKDLLKGLMDAATSEAPAPSDPAKQDNKPAPPVEARVNPAKPRYAAGAIGAVSQSIANLKSKAVVELDPFSVKAGGLVDRVSYEEGPHAELVESLRVYGQQVPILVRPHPTEQDKYQVVYGRRRLLAMQEIGEPVKALIRDLDDRELVMAQGQENTQRRDLSFIEKAHFAFQMQAEGYDRKIICDALAIDKSVVSKMVGIFDRIDYSVVRAIGAADGIGRDRWTDFAQRVEKAGIDADGLLGILSMSGPGTSSDERFEFVSKAITGAPGTRLPWSQRDVVRTADNKEEIAKVKRTQKGLTLTFNKAKAGGFDEWLAEQLPALHFQWENDLVEILAEEADRNKKKQGGTT